MMLCVAIYDAICDAMCDAMMYRMVETKESKEFWNAGWIRFNNERAIQELRPFGLAAIRTAPYLLPHVQACFGMFGHAQACFSML